MVTRPGQLPELELHDRLHGDDHRLLQHTARTKSWGQVALADFNNPGGLASSANNTFHRDHREFLDSPSACGYVGDGVRALEALTSGSLEESNVNLAEEFTNMIVSQRGYEASAKVITTADQMLQDLVNLRQ